jgi:hypothetical protein
MGLMHSANLLKPGSVICVYKACLQSSPNTVKGMALMLLSLNRQLLESRYPGRWMETGKPFGP